MVCSSTLTTIRGYSGDLMQAGVMGTRDENSKCERGHHHKGPDEGSRRKAKDQRA
ncbi:hypothetical protein PISMIDRAFT_689429 [Pisolithus microcarpus 441]|uniref:Uncharacterized protein n=1 Tax=Pisolithus microcarpus 441 TaxID=765257 RepID=A0A0C9YQ60_9AGAM|nr:hypothetical protein BKA83DRAFT_689429 [Pisolithus microcarpus]KIK12482.1 hypothetical protein PISMIDRAFT_689429 [Pisolithus microcarpus 441]